MTDKPQTDTADAINHLVDKASAGLDTISHALAQHAPQAWELAMKGAYAGGLASVIVGTVCAVLFFTFAGMCVGLGFAAARHFDKDDDSTSGGFCIGGAVISFIFGIGCFIGLCANLGSTDTWSRVIAPDGYVAQQVLTAAASTTQP